MYHDYYAAQVLAYIADKAYILGTGIGVVLLPALALTLVSFEWDDVNVTGTGATAPSAYWLQLYMVLFEIEIIDCLAVCDATFMLSYFIMIIYCLIIVKRGENKKWKKMMDICVKESGLCRFKCIYEFMTTSCCISLTIIFVMVLLEFGESGFFSPTNSVNASFLMAWSILVKIILGFRLILLARNDRYHRLKSVFDENHNGTMLKQQASDEENYKIETIELDTLPGMETNYNDPEIEMSDQLPR